MEEETSRQWSCSTNWIVSEGSFLEGSISFETSEEDAPALTSNGLVLVRAASDDPPPCEVTIFLRQTHEIHRIYARTTARTFEVYYTKDSKSDTNEYLCTVKCGPASSGSNSSAHSSEEETWVAVKNPEEIQMHYEATAEISDVDPCLSLTLRFLSLQNKSSIHIEEIYIFADPLEISSSPKSSGTNTATNFNSSMFAMLVPNLLQMSKSGFLNNKINDQYFSSDRVLNGNNEKFEDQSAKLQESGTQEIYPVERNDCINQVDEEICINSNSTERVQNANNEKVEDQTAKFENPVGQKPSTQADPKTCINTETINNNNNNNYNAKTGPNNQVEKLLEQLVSKVDKMENYFLKFEEKMLGPINNIESRLFNLENKFDEFAGDLQSLKVPFKETEPDSVWQDDSVANGVTGQTGHSRSVFRAPDFVTDTDTDTDDDDNNINNNNNNNNNINNSTSNSTSNNNNDNNNSNNINNKRKPISIDGALASALAAFASGSKLNKNLDINDDLNDQTGRVGDINIPVKYFVGSEGVVPLVSIDDVKIETVSDPFVSFKEIPQEFEQNLGPNDEFERNLGLIDGFERGISELDRNLGPIDGFEREIDELGQNSDQIDRFEKGINELGQNSDRIDGFGMGINELGQNSDQIDKFEREINELGQNSGKNDGFEKGINELDGSSDKIDGFERKINELDQNLGQIDGFQTEINELDQILGRIDEDFMSTVGPTDETTQGPEGKTQNDQGFFYKSAISEISDEEDLNFEPDLTRFKSNSTLNNSSSNSSFDESFLKTRVQVDLSDSSSTESGIFTKKPLESCEIGIGSSFIPLEDLFGDSNLQGSVFKENCSGSKGPLIDLEEENLVNLSETQVKDDNMKLFESLI